MENKFEVNSKEYWDVRFANDWESNQGREQTNFFAELAVNNLPEWLIKNINSNRFNICDMGCAEGEAVPVLSNKFYKSNVSGIDFSGEAIEKAKINYPNYSFYQGAVENLEENCDVMFCSNVLEHFVNPFNMLEKIIAKTNKHLILLLPFQEYDRGREHFFTFDYEHFQLNLEDFKMSYYKEIDGSKLEHTLWSLKQILVVYTKKELFDELDLTLENFTSTVPVLENELENVKVALKQSEEQLKLNEQKHEEQLKLNEQKYDEEIEQFRVQLEAVKIKALEIEGKYQKIENQFNGAKIEKETLVDEVKRIEALNDIHYAKMNQHVNQLNSIYNSKLWKIARPYYKFRGKRNIVNRLLNFAKRNGVKETIHVASRKANDQATKKIATQKHRNELNQILEKHKGKEIIVFPPLVDWNIPLYQRPQHIALNLAEQGYLYFFCTANMQYDNVDGFKQLSDSCFLTNRFDILQTDIESKILHLYSTDMNPHKELIDATISNGNKILYEYIDEIHEDLSGPIPKEVMDKHERLLMDEENCIAIGSADKLYNDIVEHRSKNLALVTNGVEYEHFHIEKNRYEVPQDIVAVLNKNKPIIGYFGAFATWFDYELVIKLAKERPDYEILLIGWNYDNSIQKFGLEKYNNITVVGPIQYKDLPKYAIHFSVSTIPFMINDITESTSPIKLFEYMALGHPIVTTDMPECRKYDSVLIGKNHDEFVGKIDLALTLSEDNQYTELLEKEAHDNTWKAKAVDIQNLLECN